jgi:hypothetical protein
MRFEVVDVLAVTVTVVPALLNISGVMQKSEPPQFDTRMFVGEASATPVTPSKEITAA